MEKCITHLTVQQLHWEHRNLIRRVCLLWWFLIIRHTKLLEVPSQSHQPDERKTKLTVSRIQIPNNSNHIYLLLLWSKGEKLTFAVNKRENSQFEAYFYGNWESCSDLSFVSTTLLTGQSVISSISFPITLLYTSHNVRWRNLIVTCEYTQNRYSRIWTEPI